MRAPLRFGVMTLQTVPWSVLAERWRILDASAFDSAWVGDHLTLSRFADTPLLEGWTALPALAVLTHRIRLGTLVTSITYRNPALLAKQATTLDQISDGRLELGIGAGGNPRDHAMAGVPQWDARERVARFREFIEVVDRLLRSDSAPRWRVGQPGEGGGSGYGGRYYRTQADRLAPRSVQRPRPPLTLAALGPVTIKLAARHADSWNSYVMRPASSGEALRLTRDRIGMLEEACAAIGRDPSTIVRSLLCWPFMPESPFTSLEAFRDFVGRYADIGIQEFIFYWAREEASALGADASWAKRSLDRGALDWLNDEAIPAVRTDRGEACVSR